MEDSRKNIKISESQYKDLVQLKARYELITGKPMSYGELISKIKGFFNVVINTLENQKEILEKKELMKSISNKFIAGALNVILKDKKLEKKSK